MKNIQSNKGCIKFMVMEKRTNCWSSLFETRWSVFLSTEAQCKRCSTTRFIHLKEINHHNPDKHLLTIY